MTKQETAIAEKEAVSTKETTSRKATKPAETPTAEKKKGRPKMSAEDQQKKRQERRQTAMKKRQEDQKLRAGTYKNEYDKEINDRLVGVLNEALEREVDELTANHKTALALMFLKDGDQMSVVDLAAKMNEALLPKYAEKLQASPSSDPSRDKAEPGFGLRNKIWEAQHGRSKNFTLTSGQYIANKNPHSQDGANATPRVRLTSFGLLPQTRKNLSQPENKKLIGELAAKYFRKGAIVV
jgi:hypothetical protein